MLNKKNIIGLLFLLVFSGCTLNKKASKESTDLRKEISRTEEKRMLAAIENNQLKYTSVSGKAKTKLIVNDKSFNATMNMRIKHDEAIWVSITAFLGIEVARVLITPERIKILNRLQGEYIDKPFDYIYTFTSKELSFRELEDLLVGNTLKFVIDPDLPFYKIASGLETEGIKQELNFNIQFDNAYKPIRARLSENSKNQTLQVAYKTYDRITEQLFPHFMRIVIKTPKLELEADMEYGNIHFNKKLDLPFSIPSGFEPKN